MNRASNDVSAADPDQSPDNRGAQIVSLPTQEGNVKPRWNHAIHATKIPEGSFMRPKYRKISVCSRATPNPKSARGAFS